MTVAEASPGITVAGRIFRPVTTFPTKQYNWLTSAIWLVDLDGVEDVRQLLAAVTRSDQDTAILAGLYCEDGHQWSPAKAREWMALFGGLTDGKEQAALQAALLRALPDFFPGVAVYSGSSATSSDSTPTTPPSISEASRNDSETETPKESSGSPSEPVPPIR